jgi:hypothetical protein
MPNSWRCSQMSQLVTKEYTSFFMPFHKNSFFNLDTQGQRRAANTL